MFCGKPISSSSKYAKLATRRCYCLDGHSGGCQEFPFLYHLSKTHPSVANKVKRDSTMTTGASWKSKKAGPNRILRWVMLEEDEKLIEYGIDLSKMRSQVVQKLREKSATYDMCMNVAMFLTFSVYEMPDAPKMPDDLEAFFRPLFGEARVGEGSCSICLLPLSFNLFHKAKRGKAAVETCHKQPRKHEPQNVGFAHRECNIAQGNKSLVEFYRWIEGMVKRVELAQPINPSFLLDPKAFIDQFISNGREIITKG